MSAWELRPDHLGSKCADRQAGKRTHIDRCGIAVPQFRNSGLVPLLKGNFSQEVGVFEDDRHHSPVFAVRPQGIADFEEAREKLWIVHAFLCHLNEQGSFLTIGRYAFGRLQHGL